MGTFLNPFDNYAEFVIPQAVAHIIAEQKIDVLFVSPVNSDFSEWEVAYFEDRGSKNHREYRGRLFTLPQDVVKC